MARPPEGFGHVAAGVRLSVAMKAEIVYETSQLTKRHTIPCTLLTA